MRLEQLESGEWALSIESMTLSADLPHVNSNESMREHCKFSRMKPVDITQGEELIKKYRREECTNVNKTQSRVKWILPITINVSMIDVN